MPSMKHFWAFTLSLTLAACSHLGTRSPTASDLSGTWQLDVARSDPPFRPSRADDRHREGDAHGRGSESRDSGSGGPHFGGPMPLLPMLTATQMTIDQDAASMGIAYPGSPYRDLKWGTEKRGLFTIEAGWDEHAQLIVVTKSDPLNVREIYALRDAGQTLVLQIDLQGKQINTHHMTRVFVRQADPQPQ